uniref:Uncharacterized protein n=1 Tax=Rhizobium leguminosarum bv. viciae TaxID=387 RepID=A0A0U3AU02_RHILV|nr:hypothetical protein [Rhizobium leguminosarum bv. viciae]
MDRNLSLWRIPALPVIAATFKWMHYWQGARATALTYSRGVVPSFCPLVDVDQGAICGIVTVLARKTAATRSSAH